MRRQGAALVAAAALLWAAISLFTPPLLDRGVPATGIGFWRAAIGGAAFAVHASARRAWPTRSRGLLAGFGVIGVGLFYVALAAAIDTGGVSLAFLLLYTAPAWVAGAAPVLLGEPVDRRTVTLVAITILGAALVALGGGDGVRVNAAALAWGATAGVCYATWYVISQRAATGPVATAAVALPVGAAVLLPFAFWPGDDLVVWGLLIALGLVSTYLPALAYYAGLQRVPAARAAVIATVEPVAALAIAWAAYGERLGPIAVVGAAAVVTSALLAARRPSPHQPTPSPQDPIV